MSDNRTELITITMTAEEWDALGIGATKANDYSDSHNRTYAEGLRWRSQKKIAEATPGAADRRAAALAETEARMPVLTDEKKAAIEAEARRLIEKNNEGTLEVDHLGSGPDHRNVAEGFDVTLIPHTADGGRPALHFRYTPSIHFDRKEWPLPEDDAQWFVGAVQRITGKTTHSWGRVNDDDPDNPYPTAWVSVKYQYEPTPETIANAE